MADIDEILVEHEGRLMSWRSFRELRKGRAATPRALDEQSAVSRGEGLKSGSLSASGETEFEAFPSANETTGGKASGSGRGGPALAD